MTEEEIRLYLPKYLSSSSENALKEALQAFPDVDPSKFYTTRLSKAEIVYQGDGIKNLVIMNPPDPTVKFKESIVISNTCDIAAENVRFFQSRILYAPIISLKKYKEILLEEGKTEKQIASHFESIRKQEIAQIFFLPETQPFVNESIVFLDRIINMPNDHINRKSLEKERIFTLSNFGHYLFLFKISFHFTRIQDGVDRG